KTVHASAGSAPTAIDRASLRAGSRSLPMTTAASGRTMTTRSGLVRKISEQTRKNVVTDDSVAASTASRINRCASGFSSPEVEKSTYAFDSSSTDAASTPARKSRATRVSSSQSETTEMLMESMKVEANTCRVMTVTAEIRRNQSGCV